MTEQPVTWHNITLRPYLCTLCEALFFQSASDDWPKLCPQCGKRHKQHQNILGIVFQGEEKETEP